MAVGESKSPVLPSLRADDSSETYDRADIIPGRHFRAS